MSASKTQKHFRASEHQARLSGWVHWLRRLLGGVHAESMHALLAAVDAKDSYTRNHSVNVAVYADAIAGRMGLGLSQRGTLQTASLLHDVGKIGVPDRILNKPDKLSEDEFKIMRQHPQMGVDILKPFAGLRNARRIILHHHERFDGSGYPAGCRGDDSPLGSRILAVADAVDTMLSARPYKRPLSKNQVRDELVGQAGIQFDPQVAAVAIGWMDEGGLESCESLFSERRGFAQPAFALSP